VSARAVTRTARATAPAPPDCSTFHKRHPPAGCAAPERWVQRRADRPRSSDHGVRAGGGQGTGRRAVIEELPALILPDRVMA